MGLESTPVPNVAIPSPLLAEIQAAADEELRPVAEVLRDAVETYLRARSWQKTFSYGQDRAHAAGIDETGVAQAILEYRQARNED